MKIIRSTKCSLKFITASKLFKLDAILVEYGQTVNQFIDLFWPSCPNRAALLKSIIDSVPSWLSFRLKKMAAQEAISMVLASKERWGDKAKKPIHKGQEMQISSNNASLNPSKRTSTFDHWLHLSCMGNKIILDLPIKRHKQFNKWSVKAKRLNSYIITRNYVQFCFEFDTGPKKKWNHNTTIGVDTGINALASLSNGRQFGIDIKNHIERIKRCEHGSKGQLRASRALRQRIDEVAKQTIAEADLLVVENLKGITQNTRRRLGKNIRRSIGRWNVRYWLTRLQQQCEENRVSFRTVSPYKTSQTCSACGHVDRGNRDGIEFSCLKCGFKTNADINAAMNIRERFLTGPYGAGCKLN